MSRERIRGTRFSGLIFLPKGSEGKADLKEVILSPKNASELFLKLKTDMRREAFKIEIGAGPDISPVTVAFHRVGQTAGIVAWVYEENGEFRHIHGVTAFLTRLDSNDDREAIDSVKRYKSLQVAIDPAMFDKALEGDQPVAATFFADIGSANYPVIHSLIKIVSTAFFDQFGVLNWEAHRA